MVRADAHSRSVFLADAHQRREALTNTFKFCHIFGIGVVDDGELLLIDIIAGIDAHLFHQSRSDLRSIRRVVDVCDKGRCIPAFAKACTNGLEVFRFADRRCSDAYQLAAGLDHTDRLLNGSLRIHGVRGRHRLHTNGIRRSHHQVTDGHLYGLSALSGGRLGISRHA